MVGPSLSIRRRANGWYHFKESCCGCGVCACCLFSSSRCLVPTLKLSHASGIRSPVLLRSLLRRVISRLVDRVYEANESERHGASQEAGAASSSSGTSTSRKKSKVSSRTKNKKRRKRSTSNTSKRPRA
jgi:hypothetical protein